MKDIDDILYDGEYEKFLYDNTVSEINERVDQDRELKGQIAELDADSISVANDFNDQVYRAHREERAAYDDFIASLDMADN